MDFIQRIIQTWFNCPPKKTQIDPALFYLLPEGIKKIYKLQFIKIETYELLLKPTNSLKGRKAADRLLLD